ncbi:hypothetical protein NL108_003521 [Boleophthalmus pectinirostris]|nr:hypothetical protein NL108_003521 [Boleophthalmus pectinirostris]
MRQTHKLKLSEGAHVPQFEKDLSIEIFLMLYFGTLQTNPLHLHGNKQVTDPPLIRKVTWCTFKRPKLMLFSDLCSTVISSSKTNLELCFSFITVFHLVMSCGNTGSAPLCF